MDYFIVAIVEGPYLALIVAMFVMAHRAGIALREQKD